MRSDMPPMFVNAADTERRIRWGHAPNNDCEAWSGSFDTREEAIADGRLDPARLDHYRHLLREAEFEERKRDKAAAAREKNRWKPQASKPTASSA